MKKNKINNFENKFRTKKNQKQVLLYRPYKFFTWKKKKKKRKKFLEISQIQKKYIKYIH